jgi:hypothetical protein
MTVTVKDGRPPNALCELWVADTEQLDPRALAWKPIGTKSQDDDGRDLGLVLI